jgi:hypothetical protein
MHFLALIYANPASAPQPGTPEFAAMMTGYASLTADLKTKGVFVAGGGLRPVETAKSIRTRVGMIETMDGPFAETREQLAGFYLLDVPDIDAAMAWARRIPTVGYGTIEVRPVMTY